MNHPSNTDDVIEMETGGRATLDAAGLIAFPRFQFDPARDQLIVFCGGWRYCDHGDDVERFDPRIDAVEEVHHVTPPDNHKACWRGKYACQHR